MLDHTEVKFKHWLLLSNCITAYICAGVVSMLMSVYLPSVVRDLLGDGSELTMAKAGPYLNAAYLAGMTVGGMVLGILSDRFGRVKMLAISTMVCGGATLAAVYFDDWIWVAVSRAIAGVGVSGILLSCAVLISERWPKNSRAVAQGILGVAFPVGIVLSGGLNILFDDWRKAFLVGIVPLFVAVTVPFLLEEKQGEGKDHEKKAPLTTLFSEIYRRRLIIGSIVYGFDLVGLWAIFSWMPTWVDNLLGQDDSIGKMRGVIMMLLGIGGMVGTGISGLLVNQWGVRGTLLTNLAATCGACALLFLTNSHFSVFVLVESAFIGIMLGISQGALTVYITELFPTSVRATGTGFCFNVGRVFTTSAVFFVGALVATLGGYANSMLVFSGAFMVSWIALFFDKITVSNTGLNQT